MKKVLILLLAVTLLFTGLAYSGAKEMIVIYSCLEQFRGDELQAQLAEKFPQYNIVVSYVPTGKAAARIYAEGEGSEADIILGLETGYMNNIKDNLADISGLSEVPFHPEFAPEANNNLWVTWDKQAGAIIVNKDILAKHGLEAPKTYEDLLKPEYKGLVAMPDPKSSGTGYFFFKNWTNMWGDEEALEFVDKLYPNLKQFTESGSGPIKLLKQGEIAIGLALTFQGVNERNDGQPFDIIFPDGGSPYSLTGTAIIKGHENNKGVKEVFKYIANEFVMYDKEYFSPEEIYEGQVNRIEDYPVPGKDFEYATMEGIQDYKEKERLLKIWKY